MEHLKKLFNDLAKINHTYHSVTIVRSGSNFQVHIGSENVKPLSKDMDLQAALADATKKTQEMVDKHKEELLKRKEQVLRDLAQVEAELDVTTVKFINVPVTA